MRTAPLATLALSLCLGPSVFASDATGPATPETQQESPAVTPFQAKLDEIQDLIARLRQSRQPTERRRLLLAHARAVQEAMWLSSTGAGRDYRRAPVVSAPPMRGQPSWGYHEPIRAASVLKPQTSGTVAPQRQKESTRYEVLESQLQDLAQRVEAHQLVLDEILRYREPIERLLGQSD